MKPVLFHLGSVPILGWIVMVILAFAAAAVLAAPRARALGLRQGEIFRLGLLTALAGVAGARAAYVLFHWTYYILRPEKILRLDLGGISLFGGIAAGVAAVAWLLRCWKKPIVPVLAAGLPGGILAFALARVGCFLQGCCYGTFTDLPWGVVFAPEVGLRRHPTQVYEMLFLLGLLWGVLLLERRGSRPSVRLAAAGFGYGFWRLGVGFLRADHADWMWGLTGSQIIALALAAACGWLLWKVRGGQTPRGG